MSQVNPGREGTGSGCCPDLGAVLDPKLFKAMCHPSRVAILIRLAQLGRPATVTEMTACCPNDLSVVSRHLALLREAGVLAAEKRGREVYYSVLFPDLCEALRSMADAFEACCPQSDVLPGEPSHEKTR